jgi:hypothetical protein
VGPFSAAWDGFLSYIGAAKKQRCEQIKAAREAQEAAEKEALLKAGKPIPEEDEETKQKKKNAVKDVHPVVDAVLTTLFALLLISIIMYLEEDLPTFGLYIVFSAVGISAAK